MNHTLESLQYGNDKKIPVLSSDDLLSIIKLVWGSDVFFRWHRKEFGNYPCDGLFVFNRYLHVQAFFPSDNEFEGRKLMYVQAIKNLKNTYVGGSNKPFDPELKR